MHPLIIQIRAPARREVDVPPVPQPVDLGRPDVAASRGVGGGVDDFLGGGFEPFDGGGAGDFDGGPGC